MFPFGFGWEPASISGAKALVALSSDNSRRKRAHGSAIRFSRLGSHQYSPGLPKCKLGAARRSFPPARAGGAVRTWTMGGASVYSCAAPLRLRSCAGANMKSGAAFGSVKIPHPDTAAAPSRQPGQEGQLPHDGKRETTYFGTGRTRADSVASDLYIDSGSGFDPPD